MSQIESEPKTSSDTGTFKEKKKSGSKKQKRKLGRPVMTRESKTPSLGMASIRESVGFESLKHLTGVGSSGGRSLTTMQRDVAGSTPSSPSQSPASSEASSFGGHNPNSLPRLAAMTLDNDPHPSNVVLTAQNHHRKKNKESHSSSSTTSRDKKKKKKNGGGRPIKPILTRKDMGHQSDLLSRMSLLIKTHGAGNADGGVGGPGEGTGKSHHHSSKSKKGSAKKVLRHSAPNPDSGGASDGEPAIAQNALNTLQLLTHVQRQEAALNDAIKALLTMKEQTKTRLLSLKQNNASPINLAKYASPVGSPQQQGLKPFGSVHGSPSFDSMQGLLPGPGTTPAPGSPINGIDDGPYRSTSFLKEGIGASGASGAGTVPGIGGPTPIARLRAQAMAQNGYANLNEDAMDLKASPVGSDQSSPLRGDMKNLFLSLPHLGTSPVPLTNNASNGSDMNLSPVVAAVSRSDQEPLSYGELLYQHSILSKYLQLKFNSNDMDRQNVPPPSPSPGMLSVGTGYSGHLLLGDDSSVVAGATTTTTATTGGAAGINPNTTTLRGVPLVAGTRGVTTVAGTGNGGAGVTGGGGVAGAPPTGRGGVPIITDDDNLIPPPLPDIGTLARRSRASGVRSTFVHSLTDSGTTVEAQQPSQGGPGPGPNNQGSAQSGPVPPPVVGVPSQQPISIPSVVDSPYHLPRPPQAQSPPQGRFGPVHHHGHLSGPLPPPAIHEYRPNLPRRPQPPHPGPPHAPASHHPHSRQPRGDLPPPQHHPQFYQPHHPHPHSHSHGSSHHMNGLHNRPSGGHFGGNRHVPGLSGGPLNNEMRIGLSTFRKLRERRQRKGMCKFYASGYCSYGRDCNSFHSSQETNKYELDWIMANDGFGKVCLFEDQDVSEIRSNLNGTGSGDDSSMLGDPVEDVAKMKLLQTGKDPRDTRQTRESLANKDAVLSRLKRQNYDLVAVMHLEGRHEIIEWPCVVVDVAKKVEIARFHRFVRPTFWSGEIPMHKAHDREYVNQGASAVSFVDAMNDFITFLKDDLYVDLAGCANMAEGSHRNAGNNHIYSHLHKNVRSVEDVIADAEERDKLADGEDVKEPEGKRNRKRGPSSSSSSSRKYSMTQDKWRLKKGKRQTLLFAICGNWAIKTQIPKQCAVSNIPVPFFLNEWLNVKDFILNFYQDRGVTPDDVPGMAPMLRFLHIPLNGNHHLGMDDTANLGRIVIKLMSDGALLKRTAYKRSQHKVVFELEKRINPRTTGGGKPRRGGTVSYHGPGGGGSFHQKYLDFTKQQQKQAQAAQARVHAQQQARAQAQAAAAAAHQIQQNHRIVIDPSSNNPGNDDDPGDSSPPLPEPSSSSNANNGTGGPNRMQKGISGGGGGPPSMKGGGGPGGKSGGQYRHGHSHGHGHGHGHPSGPFGGGTNGPGGGGGGGRRQMGRPPPHGSTFHHSHHHHHHHPHPPHPPSHQYGHGPSPQQPGPLPPSNHNQTVMYGPGLIAAPPPRQQIAPPLTVPSLQMGGFTNFPDSVSTMGMPLRPPPPSHGGHAPPPPPSSTMHTPMSHLSVPATDVSMVSGHAPYYPSVGPPSTLGGIPPGTLYWP